MSVVISPATTTRAVVISVSQATRPMGSSLRTASRTESEIWSAILSGWPSVTDSEVKVNERSGIAARLAGRHAEEGGERRLRFHWPAVCHERAEVRQPDRQLHACERQERQRVLQVCVDEPCRLGAHAGLRLRREEQRIGG